MEFTFNISKINKDVKRVLASPRKFFSSNISKIDWKEAVSYFVVLSFVGLLLTLIYLQFMYPLLVQYLPGFGLEPIEDTTLISLLPYALFSFVMGIAFSFFWGLAFWAWTRLFKLDGDFQKAYSTITYAKTPTYILSWVPFVNILAWVYSLYLLTVGVEQNYSTKKSKAAFLVISGVIVLFLLSSLTVTFFQ